MSMLPILDQNNEAVAEFEVESVIVETPYHPYIVKDAVVHFRAGLRQGTHATKNVALVSGSGKKPWRQKGTGRARAGKAKSPLWRHGATVFGPQSRSHALSINKKVRRKALRSALAEKIRGNGVIVLESLSLKSHKTKELVGILKTLECDRKVAIVVDEIDRNLDLASRNLSNVQLMKQGSLNVYHLLDNQKIVFVKEALSAVQQRVLS